MLSALKAAGTTVICWIFSPTASAAANKAISIQISRAFSEKNALPGICTLNRRHVHIEVAGQFIKAAFEASPKRLEAPAHT